MELNVGEAIVETTWVMKVGIKLGENHCVKLWIG